MPSPVSRAALLLLGACATASDGPMDTRPAGRIANAQWEARVDEGGALHVGERLLGRQVDPRLALAGATLVWAQEGPLRETELWMVQLPDGVPRQLTSGPGSADRPVISPDKARVAYVSGRSGVASWWVLDLATGRDTQVTNLNLGPRRPGLPPAGWMPVPDGRDYGWDSAGLHWVTGDTAYRVQP